MSEFNSRVYELKSLIEKYVRADITVSEYIVLISSFAKICSEFTKYRVLLDLITFPSDIEGFKYE